MDITTKKKFKKNVIDTIEDIDIDILDDLSIFKKSFNDGPTKKIEGFIDYYNKLLKFRSNLVNLNKELKDDIESLEALQLREEQIKLRDAALHKEGKAT